ncbi:hypothetical protein ER45_029000 (plasmid) [Bacillus mycoides]|nr:hypothetical protein ER45_029000 [Bacillus mycoides]
MKPKELTDKFIKSMGIPQESKIPLILQNTPNNQEYDQYFCLHRDTLDLLEWSLNSIHLYEDHIRDLGNTSLNDTDKYQIMQGWAQIFQLTIENWISIYKKETDLTND